MSDVGTFVYFIQVGEDGPIKIGFSRNPKERLEDLQGANFERLRLVYFCPGSRENESQLHAWFRAARGCGEWFKPVVGIADLIVRLRDGGESLQGILNGHQAAEDARRAATLPRLLEHYTDGMYEVLQRAVEAYGGIDKFAAAVNAVMGSRPRDVYDRVYRVSRNGKVKCAFLDYIAILCSTSPAAADVFVSGVCELLGYEHPRKTAALGVAR